MLAHPRPKYIINYLSDFLKIVSFSLHTIANLQFLWFNRSHPKHERGRSDGIASNLTPLIIILTSFIANKYLS